MRVVMGSRSSPPASASHSGAARQISRSQDIKKENQDDEIKEYAETAMNELLGWYGYDKVDRSDTQGLNLHHFAAQRSPSDLDSSDGSSSPGRRDPGTGTGTGSSRGSPTPADPVAAPPGCTICAWCTKIVNNKQAFSVKTPTGQKAFCSEVCFSQCRRANFKRNKTCDWCRHIRHTVNYVDFQDGEHQLQFCSDKCLNQYKMNIFCRETQAHLQMHPHLQDGAPSGSSGSGGGGGGGGGLITPDLWLRDCRSASPLSDRSLSPTPPKSPASPPPRAISMRSPSPPPPPPLLVNPPTERKLRLRRLSRSRRRVALPATVTSASTPTDLRTNCSSPRSGDEQFHPQPSTKHTNIPHLHPLPTSSLMPPILHPPPNLFRGDHPRPPFLPHGMLPPPHMLPEHMRFPMLRNPLRASPPSGGPRPPPMMPMPPHMPLNRPPFGFHHPPPRSLLPPVTVMVPYPVIIPIPFPIPIPIPIMWPKSKLVADDKEASDKSKAEGGVDKAADKPTPKGEGHVAAFLRMTTPTTPATPASSTPLPPAKTDEEEPKPKTPTARGPLRKRKRLVEPPNDDDALVKRKFVPV